MKKRDIHLGHLYAAKIVPPGEDRPRTILVRAEAMGNTGPDQSSWRVACTYETIIEGKCVRTLLLLPPQALKPA